MLSALTTNVTRFFRERPHFDHLERQVLPSLIALARKGAKVRIWSAGCSTGQEPYSVALSLLSLEPQAPGLDIKVLATDIDPRVIATGREGVYPESSLEDIPASLRTRYFAPEAASPRSYRIADELRKVVSFRTLNLNGEWPMQGLFHVIFCRNVVIYFDERGQRNFVEPVRLEARRRRLALCGALGARCRPRIRVVAQRWAHHLSAYREADVKPIRVLVVDDSATMRGLIRLDSISKDPHITVVGEAASAMEAREAIKALVPDVMTLDVQMPKMDGLEFLEKVMRLRPFPVVMVSAQTAQGTAATIAALELGAVSCVGKPRPSDPVPFAELPAEVKSAACARVDRRTRRQTPRPAVSASHTNPTDGWSRSARRPEGSRRSSRLLPASHAIVRQRRLSSTCPLPSRPPSRGALVASRRRRSKRPRTEQSWGKGKSWSRRAEPPISKSSARASGIVGSRSTSLSTAIAPRSTFCSSPWPRPAGPAHSA